MQETRVRSLCWEDPMEKGMTTRFSVLAWRFAMDRGAWRATVQGVPKSQTRQKQLSTAQHIKAVLMSPCLFNLYSEYIM